MGILRHMPRCPGFFPPNSEIYGALEVGRVQYESPEKKRRNHNIWLPMGAGEGEHMKMTFLQRTAVLAVAGALAVPSVGFAQADGAALYKSKCAMCHGADGSGGKMAPKLKGTSMSESDIVDQLTKGASGKKAPHNKPMSGLTADQAKAVATYVKGL